MYSIPTKVGIQKNIALDHWIPAFAGMVKYVHFIRGVAIFDFDSFSSGARLSHRLPLFIIL